MYPSEDLQLGACAKLLNIKVSIKLGKFFLIEKYINENKTNFFTVDGQ
jgi:hypothetical protein